MDGWDACFPGAGVGSRATNRVLECDRALAAGDAVDVAVDVCGAGRGEASPCARMRAYPVARYLSRLLLRRLESARRRIDGTRVARVTCETATRSARPRRVRRREWRRELPHRPSRRPAVGCLARHPSNHAEPASPPTDSKRRRCRDWWRELPHRPSTGSYPIARHLDGSHGAAHDPARSHYDFAARSLPSSWRVE